ncbi:MAG: hypothetical protein EOO38_01840 [Cytophagaceae bacterium]|nr:MAG: hypothetical protein EOO38_01840 [Cytophagaceae bacterium]
MSEPELLIQDIIAEVLSFLAFQASWIKEIKAEAMMASSKEPDCLDVRIPGLPASSSLSGAIELHAILTLHRPCY